MKIPKNLSYYFGILIILFSCQSEQEKLIQTKVEEIKGQWKISSFVSGSSTPDGWKNLVKTGEFSFNSCQAKNLKKDDVYCQSNIELNGNIYTLAYRFDLYFTFSLTPINTNGSGTVVFSQEDYLLTSLMAGKWELTVKDNTMFGNHIENRRNPTTLSTFTATRK